jgi:carbon-monoxide dehydrogenase catalytic subunit
MQGTWHVASVANGETKDFRITDVKKLYKVAGILEIEFEGRPVNDVARDVATKLIEDFGRQKGELNYIKRAPKKTQERWKKWGVVPRGVDREITEAMHRTHMGVDHEPDNLLLSVLKVSLADGWEGSMISTDITISSSAPQPEGRGQFRNLQEDEVSLLAWTRAVLAEIIVDVVNEPEMIAYAQTKGAKGINLGGMCCTANEVLMRHGIPTAGGFTNQELAIMTGLVDAITVDVQCIMPALTELSKKFHTKVITTSYKAKIQGALHIQYDEHRAREIARQIVKTAIDNYTNRKKEGSYITDKVPVIAGFSHE